MSDTHEIIGELESGLQEISELTCTCGSIDSEFGCPACSRHISVIAKIREAIAKLEAEHDKLAAVTKQRDDAVALNEQYHRTRQETRLFAKNAQQQRDDWIAESNKLTAERDDWKKRYEKLSSEVGILLSQIDEYRKQNIPR